MNQGISSRQQEIKNGQIATVAAMDGHNAAPNDKPLGSIITAHLQINNLLCQDDVDVLSGQMLAAQDDKTKRDVLVLWMDWIKAEDKAAKVAEANDTGYPAAWLVEFYWKSKAEQAREKIETIL